MRSIALLAVAIGLASAAVPDTHAVHEKRESRSSGWARLDRISADALLPVRIGLTQTNLDKVHEYLMDLSDPKSKNYGQIWTAEETIEAFKPTDETVNAITQWLSNEGIENVTHSDNKAWVAFNAPTSVVEKLLHAEYYEHHDLASGGVVPACDQYHVPKAIQHHIDYITPGVKLMGKAGVHFSGTTPKRSERARGQMPKSPLRWHPDRPSYRLKSAAGLSHCDEEITPACIAALYEIPEATTAHPNNSMGVYESLLQYWNQEDLDSFFTDYYPQIPNGTHPIDYLIDGAVAETDDAADDGGEAMLDLDLAYPIVYPQTITIWSEDDLNYQGQANVTYLGGFNTWLDAMDGSYCTYSAYGQTGDDTEYQLDPVYPDVLPGGYKGELQCGVFEPTTVMSISYAGPEASLPMAYQRRQCNEFAKLGLQGVSFLFASGDAGVGQYPAPYGPGCLGPEGDIFNPNWPATCPYVTAVGGTKVYPGYGVSDPESAVLDYVGHPYAVNFSSGGGFSNVHGIPSYQESALKTYFDKYSPDHPYYSALAPDATNPVLLNITDLAGNTGGVYNRIGRGIPDVSANGDNIATYSAGEYGLSGGTSASTPIFAAVINRINNERMNAGKSPVGFLNPTLYANPQILNDITNGTNIGCFTDGFPAVPGWDPVTGLGTPNYPKMLDLFMSLP